MRRGIADARIPRLVSHNSILSGATGFNGPSSEINARVVSRLNLLLLSDGTLSVPSAEREEKARGFTLVFASRCDKFSFLSITRYRWKERRLGTKKEHRGWTIARFQIRHVGLLYFLPLSSLPGLLYHCILFIYFVDIILLIPCTEKKINFRGWKCIKLFDSIAGGNALQII